MDRLIPSKGSRTQQIQGDPRLIDIVSDEADEVISALSSTTARQLLAVLNQEPRTASELADELDTTLQTVQYHLSNLREAELIEVVDTWYSNQGNEMNVYAPTTDAIALFSGERSKHRLRDYLLKILGLGIFLGTSAFAFSRIAEEMTDPISIEIPADPGEPPVIQEPEGLLPMLFEPGAAFFLGGLTIIICYLIYRHLR